MNNLVSTTWRRHTVCKSAVLNSIPPPPPNFVYYSYRFRCLFYSDVHALRSEHHRIFRHDSSLKWTYSIQSAYKCVRRELKLYISEEYDVTLVCAWRRCTAQTMDECPEVKLTTTDFPCSGSRDQWTLCIARMSIGTQFMHGAHSNKLIIWIRCVNKERHAKYAGGRARGLELRTAGVNHVTHK